MPVARTLALVVTFAALGCGSAAPEDQDRVPDAGAETTSAPGDTFVAGDSIAAEDTLVAEDTSPPPTPPGEPIAVTERETWVWVPIPTMKCADGSPSGVGVNLTDESKELVLWFQGNGVCYDALTCNLYKGLLVGMGDDPLHHMWWGNDAVGQTGIFNRKDASNPFRKSNFVVFPHCSVDGHTADKETNYAGVGTVKQHGYANVTRALERILPTFYDATRIVVAGFSAGGIGATANYHQIANAFAPYSKTLPFLVNDAGPILRTPFLSAGATGKLRTGWGLDKTIGTFCSKCLEQGMGVIYEELAKQHPGLQSSQLCAYSDTVVTSLYRLLNGDINLFDSSKLKNGLLDHATWSEGWAGPSKHRVFYYASDVHGIVTTGPLGPEVTKFLNGQLGMESSWTSVRP